MTRSIQLDPVRPVLQPSPGPCNRTTDQRVAAGLQEAADVCQGDAGRRHMLEGMMCHDQVEDSIHRAEIAFQQAESRGSSLFCQEGIYARQIVKPYIAQLVKKQPIATANIQHAIFGSCADRKDPLSEFRPPPKPAQGGSYDTAAA